MDDQYLVKLENINFKYHPDDNFGLSNINLIIRQGEIFGLLGPSGAGKSTIQKIMIKLIHGFNGQVTVLGQDILTYNRDYYEHIGVSFELPNHYLKLTAAENLQYFKSLYRGGTNSVDDLLEMVGLLEYRDKNVENFSKGMKNRLTVARALLNDPTILFLDEPTAGLDPVYKDMIIELIKKLQQQGKTIFLTTHDMHVVEKVCNRVGFIIDGKIKQIGEPDKLKKDYGSDTVKVEYSKNGIITSDVFKLNQLDTNPEFMNVLQHQQLVSIHSQEATLDDVFIKITGRSLV